MREEYAGLGALAGEGVAYAVDVGVDAACEDREPGEDALVGVGDGGFGGGDGYTGGLDGEGGGGCVGGCAGWRGEDDGAGISLDFGELAGWWLVEL